MFTSAPNLTLARTAERLDALAATLPSARSRAPDVRTFITLLRGALFPQHRPPAATTAALLTSLHSAASELALSAGNAVSTWPEHLIASLPDLATILYEDAAFTLRQDPAAASIDEVMIAYPGFAAIVIHRVAACIHRLGVPLIPRVLSEFAHAQTGIDIHPGASIASPFCIDHGTGVVIGETAIIGKRVVIYQGVTLGAIRVGKDVAGTKRHPTIEDDVVIYANATVLGGQTVIGRKSLIGGNVWVTRSVPPNSIVVRKSDIPVPNLAGDEYVI